MTNAGEQSETTRAEAEDNALERKKKVEEVRLIFDRLKKTTKQIALYRHMGERFNDYLAPVYELFTDFLKRNGILSLKVDALGFKYDNVLVFEDENREYNMIYPFWRQGVRLFNFQDGLTQNELLKFLMLTLGEEHSNVDEEDVLTKLWSAEFQHIDYIVIENFQVTPDEDPDEVEVEVDKVVAYLYRQLQSNSDDYLRFARVSADDVDLELDHVDQVRGLVVQGITATAADISRAQTMLLREEDVIFKKMVLILFQLLEVGTSEHNFDEMTEGFVQLLDVLMLKEDYSTIMKLYHQFQNVIHKPQLSDTQKDLISRCGAFFKTKMQEPQRLQMVGQTLSVGVPKDAEGIKEFLQSLGRSAIAPLLEILEGLQIAACRRLIREVLANIGKNDIETFTSHLKDPSSSLIKDMLDVIGKINPRNKFEIFSIVLAHPNPVLRMETLQLIGNNPSEDCFKYIKKAITIGDDVQMRNVAIRCLPNYAHKWSIPLLLSMVKDSSKLMKKDMSERKAIFAALGQMDSPESKAYLKDILESKGGFLAKRGLDELKMLAIGALESAPSTASLQWLVSVAQDKKKNSKEIRAHANAAALRIKSNLLGG